MNKKYIFLPIAGLIILLIGYYLFSLYRNSDNSPLESKTIYPANEIIKLNTDIYSPNESETQPIEQTADTSTPTDEGDNLPDEGDQQDAGEKYNVFIFYDEDDLSLYSPPGGNMLIPFFQVDLTHKTIKEIQQEFKEQEIYYRIEDGSEVYPKGFGKGTINPFYYDHETKYITITNDLEPGDFLIDGKIDLGEQPKTAANVKLFFEGFFRTKWGRQFYRENILNDLDNIERRTGHTIVKITDLDKDGNLEYWLKVVMNKGYNISDDIYEVEDGISVLITYVYFGH